MWDIFQLSFLWNNILLGFGIFDWNFYWSRVAWTCEKLKFDCWYILCGYLGWLKMIVCWEKEWEKERERKRERELVQIQQYHNKNHLSFLFFSVWNETPWRRRGRGGWWFWFKWNDKNWSKMCIGIEVLLNWKLWIFLSHYSLFLEIESLFIFVVGWKAYFGK